jgi:pyruvate,water dikinase
MDIVRNSTNNQKRAGRRQLSSIAVSPMRRLFLNGMASRASRYSLLKERMSSAYALGYGMFRPLFLELGTRLRDRGILNSRDDVFYLYLEELHTALGDVSKDLRDLIVSRKEEMDRSADILLPEVIFGEEAPPPISTEAKVLKGLATSKGYYRGRTRLVRSASDFGSVEEGDIVVIPYSDVSWSSIIAKASAVVSESGGVLSHCSILAREYGLPAVVSVPHAMSIPNRTTVIVDGFKGLVYLDPEGEDP